MSGNQNIVSWFVGGIANNNHQFTKQHWIFGTSNEQGASSSVHISDWIQVWRLPNQDMAKKCADYADFKFWSSTHSYTKNRHITYRLTSGTLTFDPNYCSKWCSNPIISEVARQMFYMVLQEAYLASLQKHYQIYLQQHINHIKWALTKI